MEKVSGAEKNLKRMLECLDYPMLESFTVQTKEGVMQLLLWLEDRKIRSLDIAEREPLRNDNSEWDAAVAEYLLNLGCTCPWNNANWVQCLTWLANHAVSLDYEDNRDSLVNYEAKMMQQHSGDTLGPLISQLAAVVNLTRQPGESDIDLLQRIARFARQVLSPGAISALESGALNEQSLCDFPLGFDTSNESVNKVATVLRMLYLDEFRELQNDFNSLVILGQEYTANPRTNASLGKVGK